MYIGYTRKTITLGLPDIIQPYYYLFIEMVSNAKVEHHEATRLKEEGVVRTSAKVESAATNTKIGERLQTLEEHSLGGGRRGIGDTRPL